MISRRISCLPENDKYRRLARYIVDANHDGEKALMSEHGATFSARLVPATNIKTANTKTANLTVSASCDVCRFHFAIPSKPPYKKSPIPPLQNLKTIQKAKPKRGKIKAKNCMI